MSEIKKTRYLAGLLAVARGRLLRGCAYRIALSLFVVSHVHVVGALT